MSPTTYGITGFVKDVRRNYETRAFDAYMIHPDGEVRYLGSRERSWDAEQLCDAYVHDQLLQQPVIGGEAAEAASVVCATTHDTFVALDDTGTLRIQPNGGEPITLNRQLVFALYSFFRRRDVDMLLLPVRHARSNSALTTPVRLMDKPMLISPTPATPAAPAVRIERLWSDPDTLDGLNEDGRGSLTCIRYLCGEGEAQVELCFCVHGKHPPEVSLLGHEPMPFDQLEHALENLRLLLGDPQVQQARKQYESAPAQQAC